MTLHSPRRALCLVLQLMLGIALLLPPAAVLAADTTNGQEAKLRAAADAPGRPEASRARDAARHPVETLLFFDVAPDDRVLELWPGGGWYTEVLGPYLAEEGELVVTNFDPGGPQDQYMHKMARSFADKLARERDRIGDVEVVQVAPPDQISLGADASYDVVLTFRNTHNWIRDGIDDEIYAEVFRVLKPGGTFGVVQHRAPEGADPKQAGETGYVPEAYVVETARAAGFELVARSDVNANPRDTKDHPEGVWTLPPRYRLGEKDRAKYEAIGESDRMTLKFRKPEKGGAPRPAATPGAP